MVVHPCGAATAHPRRVLSKSTLSSGGMHERLVTDGVVQPAGVSASMNRRHVLRLRRSAADFSLYCPCSTLAAADRLRCAVRRRTDRLCLGGRARPADSEALAKLDEAGDRSRCPRYFAWRPRPCRRPSSTCSRCGCAGEGEGFPGLPTAGNRMTPGLQSAELGSGVIIDKAKGYIVTNNHVDQGRRPDHGPSRSGGRRACAGWWGPTPRATWPSSRSRPI